MTEQQKFMKKYGLSQSGVSLWKKRVGAKDYQELEKMHLDSLKLRDKVLKFMEDKTINDVIHLFNHSSNAYMFMSVLYAQPLRVKIHEKQMAIYNRIAKEYNL